MPHIVDGQRYVDNSRTQLPDGAAAAGLPEEDFLEPFDEPLDEPLDDDAADELDDELESLDLAADGVDSFAAALPESGVDAAAPSDLSPDAAVDAPARESVR